MFEHVKKTIDWQGVPLTLESGLMARQADGAVLVTMGETKVLATAVGERKINTELDYFPLTVHYMERSYAAGKIPGDFSKERADPRRKKFLSLVWWIVLFVRCLIRCIVVRLKFCARFWRMIPIMMPMWRR